MALLMWFSNCLLRVRGRNLRQPVALQVELAQCTVFRTILLVTRTVSMQTVSVADVRPFSVQRKLFYTNLSVAAFGPFGFCTEVYFTVIPEATSVLLRL
jgi:hypothetical protein